MDNEALYIFYIIDSSDAYIDIMPNSFIIVILDKHVPVSCTIKLYKLFI